MNIIFDHIYVCFELYEQNGKDVWSYIKECIDNNKYLQFILEEKHLTRYRANKGQFSRTHQNFVYGYDWDKEEVMVLGVDADGYNWKHF